MFQTLSQIVYDNFKHASRLSHQNVACLKTGHSCSDLPSILVVKGFVPSGPMQLRHGVLIWYLRLGTDVFPGTKVGLST